MNNPLRFIDPDGRKIKPVTKQDAAKWTKTRAKLEMTDAGRKLLVRTDRIKYDIPPTYGSLEGANGLTKQFLRIQGASVKYITNEIILDDSKKRFDDVRTTSHELIHSADANENPIEYWMNISPVYELDGNEKSAELGAAEIRKQYNEAVKKAKKEKSSRKGEEDE